jgi:hypothetical protein
MSIFIQLGKNIKKSNAILAESNQIHGNSET